MIGGRLTAWWDPRSARGYVGRHRAVRRTRYVGLVPLGGQRSPDRDLTTDRGPTVDRRRATAPEPAAD